MTTTTMMGTTQAMKQLGHDLRIGLATLVAAIGLTMATSGSAYAQSSGSVEGIKSNEPHNSYVRMNGSTTLPGDVKLGGFSEFYSDGNSYFAKGTMSRNIMGPVSGITQLIAGTGTPTRAGPGLALGGPVADGITAKVYAIPAFINAQGKTVDNLSIAGFGAGASLGSGFSLGGFGEVNLSNPQGASWTYGELNLTYTVSDQVSVSANPALRNAHAGSVIPAVEPRVSVTYTFK